MRPYPRIDTYTRTQARQGNAAAPRRPLAALAHDGLLHVALRGGEEVAEDTLHVLRGDAVVIVVACVAEGGLVGRSVAPIRFAPQTC